METVLRCMASKHPSTWFKQLLWVEYARNTLTSSATGVSPFQCAHGLQPPLPALENNEAFICRCRQTWTQTRATLHEPWAGT